MNKCPKSSQSCHTGDYQIKVINKVPDRRIDLDWMKPSKMDNFLESCFILFCASSWFVILGLILFS